jgi:8-oxo-dGTP diphosphatase
MDGKLRNMTSVYLTGEKGILCLYRIGSRVVCDRYIGSAGGHFEQSELNDARACALREMQEELGLSESDVEGLKLRYITLRKMNGEIRQNYYFFGKLKADRELQSTEGTLRWVRDEEFEDLKMPVSAKHMILHYLKEGRNTNLLYAGITEETGTTFVPMVEFEG